MSLVLNTFTIKAFMLLTTQNKLYLWIPCSYKIVLDTITITTMIIMKSSFSSYRVLGVAYLCCLVASLQVHGMLCVDCPESKHKQHNHPSRNLISSCYCLRCRLMYNNLPLPPPPPIIREEIGTRFDTEKRLVPDGPNPLHN